MSNLHLQQCLDGYHISVPEDLLANLSQINSDNSPDDCINKAIDDAFITDYQAYTDKTKVGEHVDLQLKFGCSM